MVCRPHKLVIKTGFRLALVAYDIVMARRNSEQCVVCQLGDPILKQIFEIFEIFSEKIITSRDLKYVFLLEKSKN